MDYSDSEEDFSDNESEEEEGESESLPKSSLIEPTTIVHEGWATKQGSFVKNWKKRWFTLTGNGILTYHKKKGEKKLKAVKIDHKTEIELLTDKEFSHSDSKLKPFAIKLSRPEEEPPAGSKKKKSKGMTFLCQMDTREKLNVWITKFSNVIAQKRTEFIYRAVQIPLRIKENDLYIQQEMIKYMMKQQDIIKSISIPELKSNCLDEVLIKQQKDNEKKMKKIAEKNWFFFVDYKALVSDFFSQKKAFTKYIPKLAGLVNLKIFKAILIKIEEFLSTHEIAKTIFNKACWKRIISVKIVERLKNKTDFLGVKVEDGILYVCINKEYDYVEGTKGQFEISDEEFGNAFESSDGYGKLGLVLNIHTKGEEAKNSLIDDLNEFFVTKIDEIDSEAILQKKIKKEGFKIVVDYPELLKNNPEIEKNYFHYSNLSEIIMKKYLKYLTRSIITLLEQDVNSIVKNRIIKYCKKRTISFSLLGKDSSNEQPVTCSFSKNGVLQVAVKYIPSIIVSSLGKEVFTISYVSSLFTLNDDLPLLGELQVHKTKHKIGKKLLQNLSSITGDPTWRIDLDWKHIFSSTSSFPYSNSMCSHLLSIFSSLAVGFNELFKEEYMDVIKSTITNTLKSRIIKFQFSKDPVKDCLSLSVSDVGDLVVVAYIDSENPRSWINEKILRSPICVSSIFGKTQNSLFLSIQQEKLKIKLETALSILDKLFLRSGKETSEDNKWKIEMNFEENIAELQKNNANYRDQKFGEILMRYVTQLIERIETFLDNDSQNIKFNKFFEVFSEKTIFVKIDSSDKKYRFVDCGICDKQDGKITLVIKNFGKNVEDLAFGKNSIQAVLFRI